MSNHPLVVDGARPLALLLLVCTLVVGCGSDGESAAGPAESAKPGAGEGAPAPLPGEPPASPPSEAASCVPDQATFEDQVRPVLAQRCGHCHGDTPDFGAPFALLDYDTLVAGTPGERRSDRVFAQLASGLMPPPGNLRPPPDEHDLLVSWASCGTEMPPYPTALSASRPIFAAADEPPAGTEVVRLTADAFRVGAQTVDLYQDFTFADSVTDEKFVRRIYVDIDKSRVVHHITLHYDNPDNTNYLYAWAPGTGAVQFEDGGLRIGPDTRFRVEIHYNNATDVEEVDNSGVLLWVAEPEGIEYAMIDPATFQIQVPPLDVGYAEVTCTAETDFTILAGLPHMHEIGESFLHTITRADTGETEEIIALDGWSFDLQFFYAMDVDVRAGDTLYLRCGYRNDKERTVQGGLGTSDEMCYDFLYVKPASGSLRCGNGFGEAPSD